MSRAFYLFLGTALAVGTGCLVEAFTLNAKPRQKIGRVHMHREAPIQAADVQLVAIARRVNLADQNLDIETFRRMALAIVRAAITRRPNPVYSRVEEALKRMPIHAPPPGHDFSLCALRNFQTVSGTIAPNVAMFYYDSQVRMCQVNFASSSSRAAVPQLLIHEAVHASGLLNECETVKLEYSINGDGNPLGTLGSGYDCPGLTTDYRVNYALQEGPTLRPDVNSQMMTAQATLPPTPRAPVDLPQRPAQERAPEPQLPQSLNGAETSARAETIVSELRQLDEQDVESSLGEIEWFETPTRMRLNSTVQNLRLNRSPVEGDHHSLRVSSDVDRTQVRGIRGLGRSQNGSFTLAEISLQLHGERRMVKAWIPTSSF